MNFATKAVVLLAMSVATWAADDPFLGTWKLNVGKSKMSSGAAPEARVETFTANPDGYRLTMGESSVTLYFDRKDHPRDRGNVAIAVGADTASAQRINSRKIQTTFKRGGKPIATVTREVSADGRSLTATGDGITLKGEKFHNVLVFEKQ